MDTPKQYDIKDIIMIFDILYEEGVFDKVDFVKIFETLDKRKALNNKKCEICSTPLISVNTHKGIIFKCFKCNN
jgi:aspartate/methionine/tyrosine aminotransferase